MNEFLTFRRMITPLIIQGLFWLGAGFCVLAGLVMIGGGLSSSSGGSAVLGGLLLLVVGPVVVRVYCELLILLFRMNETLTDIRNSAGPAKSS
jgi:hypothetical protein